MFFVYYYKDIIYNIAYKDYKKIISEIDSDMPDEYKKEIEEVAKDKEKVENYKFGYYDTFYYTKKECGRGYKLGYDIIRADEVELE